MISRKITTEEINKTLKCLLKEMTEDLVNYRKEGRLPPAELQERMADLKKIISDNNLFIKKLRN